MEVNLNQFFVANGQQAVSLKIGSEIVIDFIFVKVFAFNQKLCVIFIFQHFYSLQIRFAVLLP